MLYLQIYALAKEFIDKLASNYGNLFLLSFHFLDFLKKLKQNLRINIEHGVDWSNNFGWILK